MHYVCVDSMYVYLSIYIYICLFACLLPLKHCKGFFGVSQVVKYTQKRFKPVTLLREAVLDFFSPFLCIVTFLVLLFFENCSIFPHQSLCSCFYYTLMVIRPKEIMDCCHLGVFWGPFGVLFMRNVQCFFMVFCINIFVLLCQPQNEKKCCILFLFCTILGSFCTHFGCFSMS